MSSKSGLIKPIGVALWLLRNSSLTYKQIAEFCDLSSVTISAMEDGEYDANVLPFNPVLSRQLTQEEIHRCEADGDSSLRMEGFDLGPVKIKKAISYVPLSRRNDKINAIMWLLKSYPILPKTAIARLVNGSKLTVESIADGTHRKIPSIVQQSPVSLGLCSEADIENSVAKAERQSKNKSKK